MGRPKKEVPVDINETATEKTPVAVEPNDEEYNINIISDYYGAVDPFYLSDKDPRYVYRFLRADDKNLSIKTSNLLHEKGGWQVVGSGHAKRLGIADEYIKKDDKLGPDGAYRVGDTILAFMPKELYAKKEKVKQEKANAPLKAVDRLLKEGDPSAGKGIHNSLEGLKPEKELQGNWK